MPEPLKALPDGRRSLVIAPIVEGLKARPSLEGGPSAPPGSMKPFREQERWSPIEYFLAIFAIPLYLYRTMGLFRFIVLFMVVWTAYGQLTIWLDFGYNEDLRAQLTGESKSAMLYMGNGDVAHQCRIPWVGDNPPQGWPLESVYEGNNPAGWPFGKLYMFGTSCTNEVAKQIFGWIGPYPGMEGWLNERYEDSMWAYAIERRLGFSYVFLGFVALIDLVLLVPWLLVWGAWQVYTHLNFSWD